MDLRFTDDELAFRAEVREFIRTRLPEAIHRKVAEGRALRKDEIVQWQRTLNEKGWATPSWPRACPRSAMRDCSGVPPPATRNMTVPCARTGALIVPVVVEVDPVHRLVSV